MKQKSQTLGRPRDPDVETRILDATLRLLREDGFTRMSIDAISAASGASKPTIYRRWSGKEDLATAALERLRVSEPSTEGKQGMAKARAILLNFRTSLLRPNGMALIGVVLAEEAHNPELLAHFRDRVVKPRREMLSEALKEACQMGELSAHADIDALVNMLIGSFYARYLSGSPISPVWVNRIVSQLRNRRGAQAACGAPGRPR